MNTSRILVPVTPETDAKLMHNGDYDAVYSPVRRCLVLTPKKKWWQRCCLFKERE